MLCLLKCKTNKGNGFDFLATEWSDNSFSPDF